MAITTLDGALAGMQPPVYLNKAATPTLVAGRPHSLWYLGGIPGPGTSDKISSGGVALSTPQNGALAFTNPGSGNSYLSLVRGQNATQAGSLWLCDRLLVCGYQTSTSGAISMTSTSAQTLNTTTLPSRDNAGASNADLRPLVDCAKPTVVQTLKTPLPMPCIRVSEANNGHTQTLLSTLAHEMIHLRQHLTGDREHHGTRFRRMAARVCAVHGFDPKIF